MREKRDMIVEGMQRHIDSVGVKNTQGVYAIKRTYIKCEIRARGLIVEKGNKMQQDWKHVEEHHVKRQLMY